MRLPGKKHIVGIDGSPKIVGIQPQFIKPDPPEETEVETVEVPSNFNTEVVEE